jgi:hypothetical protein
VEGLPRIDTSSPPTRKGSAPRSGGPPSSPRGKPPLPSKVAPARSDDPSRPKIKTSWTDIHFQGLPIVFWILFLAGIGAAAALAIAFLKSRT